MSAMSASFLEKSKIAPDPNGKRKQKTDGVITSMILPVFPLIQFAKNFSQKRRNENITANEFLSCWWRLSSESNSIRSSNNQP
jgi:hypothetical protein